jgi:hypothetical protein
LTHEIFPLHKVCKWDQPMFDQTLLPQRISIVSWTQGEIVLPWEHIGAFISSSISIIMKNFYFS